MNKAKKKDWRFWIKWRFSGAVEPMVLIRVECLFCDYFRMEKLPQSFEGACCICKECEAKAA